MSDQAMTPATTSLDDLRRYLRTVRNWSDHQPDLGPLLLGAMRQAGRERTFRELLDVLPPRATIMRDETKILYTVGNISGDYASWYAQQQQIKNDPAKLRSRENEALYTAIKLLTQMPEDLLSSRGDQASRLARALKQGEIPAQFRQVAKMLRDYERAAGIGPQESIFPQGGEAMEDIALEVLEVADDLNDPTRALLSESIEKAADGDEKKEAEKRQYPTPNEVSAILRSLHPVLPRPQPAEQQGGGGSLFMTALSAPIAGGAALVNYGIRMRQARLMSQFAESWRDIQTAHERAGETGDQEPLRQASEKMFSLGKKLASGIGNAGGNPEAFAAHVSGWSERAGLQDLGQSFANLMEGFGDFVRRILDRLHLTASNAQGSLRMAPSGS
jgi:hypothetical protein